MRATVCLEIAGVDTYAEIEFRCTYKGYAGCGPSMSGPGDPPEPPEFEIDSLELFEDWPKKEKKQLECPKWLAVAIEEHDKTFEAMCDAYRDYERDDY